MSKGCSSSVLIEQSSKHQIKWTWMKILTLFNILFSSFIEGTLFMFISSFFPKFALDKGLSESEVGFIVGSFPISAILISFISGFIVRIMTARTIFFTSYMISGAILLPFMFCEEIQSLKVYILFCFCCRIMQGIGNAGIRLSGFMVLTSSYQPLITTFTGAYGMSYALGLSFGPFTSSLLCQKLGFKAPFILMIGIIILTIIFSYFFFEEESTSKANKEKEEIKFLRKFIEVPEMFFIFISILLTNAYHSFRYFILTVYIINTFDLDIAGAGSYMLIEPIILSIFGPIVGVIVDKTGKALNTMVFGSLLISLTLFLLGPAPFFNIKPSLTLLITFLVLSGIAMALKYTPRFSAAYELLRFRKIEVTQTWQNYLNVGTMLSTSIGIFIGPFGGGLLLQYTNYAWTQTIFGFIELLTFALMASFLIFSKRHHTVSF